MTGFQFFNDVLGSGVKLSQIQTYLPFEHMLAINTKLDNFEIATYGDPCPKVVSNSFLHSLFEARIKIDFSTVFGQSSVYCSVGRSPLDKYVAGYCIANSSSTTSWNIDMEGKGSDASFLWGLKSSCSDSGIISHLRMVVLHPISLTSYPMCILEGLRSLTVLMKVEQYVPNLCAKVVRSLIQAIPLMKNLSSLSLALPFYPLDLLNVVCHNSVTTLILRKDTLSWIPSVNLAFINSMQNLINPSSSSLKNLVLDLRLAHSDLKALCSIVFGQTSLNQLTLCTDFFCEEPWNLLQANTCLTHVQFKGKILHPFKAFSKVLQNRTIQVLRWYFSLMMYIMVDSEQIKAFQEALSANTTLKEFIFVLKRSDLEHDLDWPWLTSDPRVTLIYV